MLSNGKPARRTELINSVSVLKETLNALAGLEGGASGRLGLELTAETRKLLAAIHDTAGKLRRMAADLLPREVQRLDECIKFEEITRPKRRRGGPIG